MNRPSRSDISKPKVDDYGYKKEFYRDVAVAADYDEHRFKTASRKRRNVRKWRAIGKALDRVGDIRSILDLPCGTGRFTGHLAARGFDVVGGDISLQMMREAGRSKFPPEASVLGYVQSDAESLPFQTASLDGIVSIRFMFHVDPVTRRRILREMGRVARKWIIIDYRHRYSIRWLLWQLRRSVGLLEQVPERVSRRGMQSEFDDAGLKIREVIPVRRWLSDKWIVLAEAPHDEIAFEPRLVEEALDGTDLEGVEIIGRLGEGRRSIVYRAGWRGADVALKVFKREAIATHARKTSQNIADFEHQRNTELFTVPGLERYVAEPLAVAVTPVVQAIAQEPIDGELYYFFYQELQGKVPPSFEDHLKQILRLSHGAGFYDIDLHSMNLLVAREADGEFVPKLFDFNLIPYTVRPQNPLIGWLLASGLMSKKSRDQRRLRTLHDFRHVEKRLLKFHQTDVDSLEDPE